MFINAATSMPTWTLEVEVTVILRVGSLANHVPCLTHLIEKQREIRSKPSIFVMIYIEQSSVPHPII